MKYKCIIFDCDGILVDSETISAQIFMDMAGELGFYMDLDFAVEQFTGLSMKEHIRFLEEQLNHKLPDDFEQKYRSRTYEAFRTDLQPVEGVRELLDRITIPVGVASSGPYVKIKMNLTTTGLIHKFGQNIFSSYDIGSWKPDPGIYLHAARQMGFEPGECAVIEDSEVGVQAALAGGFCVYVLSEENNCDKYAQMGAKVFTDMKMVAGLIGVE